MSTPPRVAKPRPVYLDLPRMRQPIPAIASILHRVSGALLFVVGVPALLWGVQASLASPTLGMLPPARCVSSTRPLPRSGRWVFTDIGYIRQSDFNRRT